MNKAYLDTNISKKEGLLSFIEKDYIEISLHNSKISREEVLIERALKLTLQIFYDKGLLDNFNNADEMLKDYLPIEVNERRRLDLDPLSDNDNVIQ